MNPRTGAFPAAVQIGTAALDRLLAAMVTSGTFPTVFPRQTPGNPLARDLFLWNLRTAIPDAVEGVPDALVVEFSWIMQGGLDAVNWIGAASVAGSVRLGPDGGLRLDFTQIPLGAVTIGLNEDAPPIGFVLQAAFWAGMRELEFVALLPPLGRPVDVRVLSGPAGRALHLCVGLPGTEPAPPPAGSPWVVPGTDVATIVSDEAILSAAMQAVLQQTAQWKLGSRLIYDADVVLDSFAWTAVPGYLHGEGTADYETDLVVNVDGTEVRLTAGADFSLDMLFYLTDPTPAAPATLRLGIADVSVDADWLSDLIAGAFLTPVGGTALVESIERQAEKTIVQGTEKGLGRAVDEMNPLQAAGGSRLPIVHDMVSFGPGGLVVSSHVPATVGMVDPIDRIPSILANKRSKVFHRSDCFYGSRIYGPVRFGLDSVGLAEARALYNGCWTCMREWHRRAAGDVRVVLRATDQPNGKPTLPLRLSGEPLELFDDDGFGVRESFVKETELTAQADEHAIVVVKTKLPRLAAGRWRITAGTHLLPSWKPQGERRVSKNTPAPPLYFRVGHDGAEPYLAEPMDPNVAPAALRLVLRVRGGSASALQSQQVVVRATLAQPVELWGIGAAEVAPTRDLLDPALAAWTGADTVEWSLDLAGLIPGHWKVAVQLPGLASFGGRSADLAPGQSASLDLGTLQHP